MSAGFGRARIGKRFGFHDRGTGNSHCRSSRFATSKIRSAKDWQIQK
jgi:hypothetical protein